ncbi:unnamed protein product [Fraxinus pennsylvanica]|uniref:Uncharacterized protein n=1 Tax=Fraxinus pennsylvanica TaxID=56036 RepID=A0AAD2A0M1_9LAMI|nr:unnamed protein product [Fraxinus pennsylvanica]
MVSSRELCRDAASFFVYFCVFLHVFTLNFVYSQCPKSFQCGNLGTLSFPLTKFSQPGCGLFAVQCNALPNPRIHLDTERLSTSYEIISNISTNRALIRNPILESLLQRKSKLKLVVAAGASASAADLTPNEGIYSVHAGSILSMSSTPWQGPFLCTDCHDKMDGCNGRKTAKWS